MGSIVAFFGCGGKCGLSQTALSLALCEGGRPSSKKVLLVYAQEALGDDYIRGIRVSFKDLRHFLKDRVWDSFDICLRASVPGAVSVIGGADIAGSAPMFRPDDVCALIRELSEAYDLVICDCGSDISHGLSIGAMQSASSVYLVSDQSEKCLRRYEWLEPYFEKVGTVFSGTIIAGYQGGSPYDIAYLSEKFRTGRNAVHIIPFSEKGILAETMRRPLIGFRERKYVSAVQTLAKRIEEENGI